MANSLYGGTYGAMSPMYWSKRMGRKLYKTDVFRSLADFEEQATLRDGQKVNRPYRSDIVVENYTRGTALTAQDLTATDDVLTVDTVKAALLYVDNVDKIQNKYSAANLWIDEAGRRLSNSIDARFLYEVVNANNTVDDGTIGGTSGNGITVTTSNILDVFASVNLALDLKNVEEENRFFVISPHFYQVLWRYIAGKVTMLGDKTGQNGNIGQFAGLQLFKSNNLMGSATWTPTATITKDTDTLTINSVVFQAVTTPAAAGDVLADTTSHFLYYLSDLINAGGVGTTSQSISLAIADRRTVQSWVAVPLTSAGAAGAATTTASLEIRVKGASYLTVSSSNSSNPWTAATEFQNLLAGRFGAIDAVIQKEPSVEMGPTVAAGTSGMNILPMTLFGVYTFYQGKNEIVRIKVRSDAY